VTFKNASDLDGSLTKEYYKNVYVPHETELNPKRFLFDAK
jgi:hypothetical protein